jgi:hypothetical protein
MMFSMVGGSDCSHAVSEPLTVDTHLPDLRLRASSF